MRVVVRFAAKVCRLHKVAIENMPFANRQAVISEVSKLMTPWPDNFVGTLIKRKHSTRTLLALVSYFRFGWRHVFTLSRSTNVLIGIVKRLPQLLRSL